MTRHISFDLESLSLQPNAMILAIGAVEFDVVTGQLGTHFYRTIDITAKGGGGVIDPSTVKWWVNQSLEARNRAFADPEAVPLAQALIDFSEWLGFDDSLAEGEYPDLQMWARGDKDGQWLACAYDGLGFKLPYQYWQLNDQRTITNLFPKKFFDYGDSVAHDALAHDALADATAQAKHLIQALTALGTVTRPLHEQVESDHKFVGFAEDLVEELKAPYMYGGLTEFLKKPE